MNAITPPRSAIANKAYEARLSLEQADMRLCGVMAAHHMIHSNAESDTPISSELLYPYLLVLDDALETIRAAMEGADFVLSEVQRSGSDGGRCDSKLSEDCRTICRVD